MPKWNGGVIGAANNPTISSAKGIWSLSEATKAIRAGLWPPSNAGADPYFENVTMLLSANGTNGAQNNTFLDSSTNNFTITRNGNTTQGTFTPFSKYAGAWGNYFDGTGDYLTLASSADFNIFGGDMTAECWFYSTASSLGSRSEHLFAFVQDATNRESLYFNGTTLTFWTSSSAGNGPRITFAGITQNQWVHVAVVKSGSTFTMYVNGVSAGTSTTTQYSTASQSLQIGTYNNASSPGDSFTGYISNVRVVKGTAIYTSAFIPSTTPLTSPTNTVLLTCQANRFVDSNTQVAAKTVTPSGDVSVQTFSPFPSLTAYSAGTNGGSGYFDGSGDYVSTAYNSNLLLNGVDSTIEGWFYLATAPGTAASATAVPFIYQGNGYAGSPNLNWAIFADNTNVYFLGAGATYISASVSVLPVRSWFHLAICVTSGTSATLYVNGVSQATGAITAIGSSTSYSTGVGGGYQAGASPIAQYMNGYASNIRITKGAKLYTTNFTPPTALLTTTVSSGTVQLLLNFTNGGIVDAAMSNDLETVGNAQISTTQSKFGGSSIYLGGTGDYLVGPARKTNDFNAGDFTIECWIYFNSVANAQIASAGGGPVSGAYYWQYYSSELQFGGNTSPGQLIAASWTPSSNTWYHIAITRSGTTLRQFVNGTQLGTNATSSHSFTDASTQIGYGGAGYLNGYIDDFRITKGYARYTANFTAPVGPFNGFGD